MRALPGVDALRWGSTSPAYSTSLLTAPLIPTATLTHPHRDPLSPGPPLEVQTPAAAKTPKATKPKAEGEKKKKTPAKVGSHSQLQV